MRQWLASITFLLLSGIAVDAASAAGADAAPQPPPTPARDAIYAADVTEAAQRFGIPEAWIRAVIRAESGGNARARSRVGAQGLMQLMPATWHMLRDRLGLGPDPFEPHDNIIAGTAYLREMYDLFGPAGVLAAYNAGPGRYAEYLAQARPLPAETHAYVAATAGFLAAPSHAAGTATAAPVISPQQPNAPLPATAMAAGDEVSAAAAPRRLVPVTRDLSGLTPLATGLFVATGVHEARQ